MSSFKPVYRRLSPYERASAYAMLFRQVLPDRQWEAYMARKLAMYDEEGNWIPPSMRRYRSYSGGKRVWDDVPQDEIKDALLSSEHHPTVVYIERENLKEEIVGSVGGGIVTPKQVTLWAVLTPTGAPLTLGGREQIILAYLYAHPLSTSKQITAATFLSDKPFNYRWRKTRTAIANLVRKGVLKWTYPPAKNARKYGRRYLLSDLGCAAYDFLCLMNRVPVLPNTRSIPAEAS